MNKKIDEIIEQIKTAINFKKSPLSIDYHISIYDMEKLLDYITNLQERNDKAIETLEKRIEENEEIDYVDMTGKSYINYQKEIIDILRGEDNDNN